MGVVTLVGAGPGDASLITVKGLERLKTCDVVIYDRLASEVDTRRLYPCFCGETPRRPFDETGGD